MLSQTTRASLLTRVASLADTEAWREFYATYGILIRSTARRAGLQPADCDDVAQAVFASMVRAMPGFVYNRKRGRFRAYLKTITLHEVARWRHRMPGAQPGGTADRMTELPAGADLDSIWESEWRQHHMRLALRKVESAFSAQDLEAFRRYALENHEPQRIALEMGLSIHQVYKAKARILQRLRDLVREQIDMDS